MTGSDRKRSGLKGKSDIQWQFWIGAWKRYCITKQSSDSQLEVPGDNNLPAAANHNDYSYLLKERHSSSPGASQPTSDERPQTGQPFAFQSKSLHVPERVRNAMSSSAFSLHSPSSRQSQISIPPETADIKLTHSMSHQPPLGSQLQPAALKRTGSAIPSKAAKERSHGSGSSVGSIPSASRWFRRGRNRSNSKPKEAPASGYHLDMNFNDLSSFVDLSKVRRPSITSSLGTGDSSLNASHATGDSSKEDANSMLLAPSDAASIYAAEKRRQRGSSANRGRRKSQATIASPLLKEAVTSDARSVASSMKRSLPRMSSANSALNSSASQKSDAQLWASDHSWQHRDSSVKSRQQTTLSGDGDSDYEYQGSINDHGSVQSAPVFEDRQPLMHFTDPWAADRNQQRVLYPSVSDQVASGAQNASTASLRNATDQVLPYESPHAKVAGAIPEVEYPPRRSEPWAPPESWAVLPTTHEGADETGTLNYGPKELVSDSEDVSSDSEIEDDNNMYSLRIYKEDSTFGTFHCRLSTTTADFMQMAAKKFFIHDITRYCLYMQKANGLDRTLTANERPANILKNYLEQMGYRPEDNITLQGREDNSYLCKFSLFKAAIPRVSQNMEVEVTSYQHVDLRARKLQAVPVFLYAHANKIVSLNMSKNPGLNFPTDFVQLCGNMRELRLSTCQFSRFPNSIQYFPLLSFLDLSGNDIKQMRHAPLDKLDRLTTLMLRNNRLVDLPESLARIRSLRVLNVSNNNLATFPQVVTRIQSLEELDISLNRIPRIPDAISALTNLVKLNVMGNALTGNLPNGLGRLAKLEELDVRQNKLQDFEIVSELAGLKLLYTETNMVTRAHMDLSCAVSVSLRANKLTQCHLTNPARTLVFLDLSRNQLTELPSDVFMNLSILEHLILDSNHIVSIPPSIGNLKNLKYLSCANNILSLIPIELARLENLATLDLHSNNLKLLPPEIWLMPKLVVLNLSSNLLEQFPHPSMLENLRRQQGGSNSVRAVAAAAAAAAAAVQRTGNKAPIPSRVAQTMQMSMPTTRQGSPLVRASSEIGSEAPETRSETSSPLVTDRIRNRSADGGRFTALTPPVPLKRYSITDPPPLSLSLRELRMGDNNLDDEIFTLMAYLPELRVLNLSYNELYDLQPSAMVHMRKITELYLSGTQISTIPEEEPNAIFWRNLRLLNINGNKLQTLPSWLAKIHGLTVLDVGSNVLKYNITNWPYDWNWNWNTGLKYLNFSYNERFEIKGAHMHTKAFHDHAKLVGNEADNGPARDLFNYITKEPPKSDCVSDFYQLTDLRILGLLQLTIMVPLPEETPNRRVRTTDPIKHVKYGIADTLGNEDRLSAWDLASSRFRMADNECLFGLFHARETGAYSSAISKYLCDNFFYVFRDELDKVTDQMQSDEHDIRASQHGNSSDGKKTVNFIESTTSAEGAQNVPSQPNDRQVHAALRRTFLTLNKDLGTHNRQLVAAAEAAEAYAARTARPSTAATGNVSDAPAQTHHLTSADISTPGHGVFGAKNSESAACDSQGGSTAAVAYIHGRMLHVANVGDALGVVSRRGTPVMLSARHDPYDVSEVRRIRSIGGYITQQGKVQGQIDVTRAFGYFHLLPYVNADPTINTMLLTEEDEFLILANRPVWDAITPQIAVDIARKHRRDPRLAAARVRDHVVAYGVTKSIMVMVIGFGPMFAKNTGRPMRGFSVRDSIYPGVPDHRARYAMSRRMSRSPSAAMPPAFGSRPSVSHPVLVDGKGIGMFPIAGASSSSSGSMIPTQPSPYDMMDEFDEFSSMPLTRTRRQRDRDVSARPGDSTLARLEREVPPPVGEVALVFTDVKNSTVQWETNPVAMRSAIKVHNGIMRRMLRSIGGYEVKTEGDAFMVSFPTVASALHWCLAVQMTFLTADWPQEILDSPHGCPIYWPPDDDAGNDGARARKSSNFGEGDGRHLIYRGLRVRMGVHFGNPVSEEDPITRRMDYFGPMVNRAARISGAADGGQVYVSQDVMDEVFAILGLFDTADHSGIADMRQIIDEPTLARDVQALKNLGLCAVQVGEIRLKGLESPEFVSHVYPVSLRGRIDMQIQEEEEVQKQKQLQKKKKQEWSTGNSKLAKQRGNKAFKSTESLSPSMNSAHGGQRSSLDEGSLQAYSDVASPHALTALSSPRESAIKQASVPPQQQRLVRDLSLDLTAGANGDIRGGARQIDNVPLWSAPLARRSISLLHNYMGVPEQLESIGEDSSVTIYPGSEAPYEFGRVSKDYGISRMQTNYSSTSSLRQPFYLPPPYYPYGSMNGLNSWSRQGSAYLNGGPMAGSMWQPLISRSQQGSRGSIDPAMTIRGHSSVGLNSNYNILDSRFGDPRQLDILYQLAYRLQILAAEPDTNTVLPSFHYFVAHQANDLASYRIHRASTVSVASGQYRPTITGRAPQFAKTATMQKPNLEDARTRSANPQPSKAAPRFSISSTEDAFDEAESLSNHQIFQKKENELATYPSPFTPATVAAAAATTSKMASAPVGDKSQQLRPRSVSPTLAQPMPMHKSLMHRHTQSASPASQHMSSSTTRISELASQGIVEAPAPLALNEPPIPMYLYDGMSQQHMVAVLAMLIRQVECAVDALEMRMNAQDESADLRTSKRNDSKMDTADADDSLKMALECVAQDSQLSIASGFEWTADHVMKALEAYANRHKGHAD
ncbi:cysteinyl-tRNA synthetase [Coemansia brasiliensis]|uniref:Adenylate cyclase n=1 Tax=Coemansia brasiliensis TaxID=2650707 RepID=A0A9W8IBH8_9FUNG|nr:cysteinyl-tRNA synthetase [Coemansia brasiliensis]